jgi:hypothetical protein
VHVVHGLAAMVPRVEDDAITGVGDALGKRYLVGVGNEAGQQPVVGGRQLGQIGVMLPRDHKYVNGSLRINVAERDRTGITGHYCRRYLSGGNAAEQAVRHKKDLIVYRASDAADRYGCLLRTHGAPPLWCNGLASFWLSVARGRDMRGRCAKA